MNEQIRNAFLEASGGYSADRVVADPVLNQVYINRCHSLGVDASPVELNLLLLNARKAGLLTGLRRSRRTSFPDEDSYCFGSEIAARFIEKRDSTTLDRIICNPSVAQEFDGLAADIAPGYSSLQYRWAALNLRKARSLRPELFSHIVRPVAVSILPIEGLVEADVPMQQGIYIFYSPAETLYVGEGQSLRKRVAKHLDHSDNKNLARWFWANGFRGVHLEMQVLEENTTVKVRKALEAELISSRRPIFNIQAVPSHR